MADNNQSTGMLIAKLVVFVILAFAALRIAVWVFKLALSLFMVAVNIAVIVLVVYGIYYLLFGRNKNKF